MKTCGKCKVEKELSEFHKDKTRKDGLHNQCKACKRERSRRWNEANPEYRQVNADRIAENKKRFLKANPDYQKRWREDNSAAVAESNRRWERANPDKVREKDARRRSLKADATQGFHYPTYGELIAFYGRPCLYPGCEATETTVDHIVPLAKGGAHGLWNFQPLCKSHNSSKRDRHSMDYRHGDKWCDRIPGLGNIIYRRYTA